MKPIIPSKIKIGDEIRVIAPATSLGIISEEIQFIANERFNSLGLRLSFGAHVNDMDEYHSTSIENRIADLHDAFSDPKVKAIICVIGGFNSNQLLPYINWDIIRNNAKPFIGYSDITALQNAVLSQTDLVTYSGPAYSTFGQKIFSEYTLEHFKKCLMQEEPFELDVSTQWTDDEWYIDQDNRIQENNEGLWILQEGKAEGVVVGGNISTLHLLCGTKFMPSLKQSILFLEDDSDTDYKNFDRMFESLLQLPEAGSIAGIVFGRFQKASEITEENMRRLVAIRPQLKNIPIIANADFGHTNPMVTYPIGGKASLAVSKSNAQLIFNTH